jgi:hypothetical protein
MISRLILTPNSFARAINDLKEKLEQDKKVAKELHVSVQSGKYKEWREQAEICLCCPSASKTVC